MAVNDRWYCWLGRGSSPKTYSPRYEKLKFRFVDFGKKPHKKLEKAQRNDYLRLGKAYFWAILKPHLGIPRNQLQKSHMREAACKSNRHRKGRDPTVDGSEIQRAPVEVGSLPHYLRGFKHPRWFFRRISEPSTVGFCCASSFNCRHVHHDGWSKFQWWDCHRVDPPWRLFKWWNIEPGFL